MGRLLLSAVHNHLQTKGPSLLHFETCAASAQAITDGFNMLRDNVADIVICGGVSAKIDSLTISRLSKIGALAPTSDPVKSSCRPFHLSRNGFILGEGSAILILERHLDAHNRGHIPKVFLAGYGVSTDGHSITDPDPNGHGMSLSMQRALIKAKMNPEEIDYINAHGTGTIKNDKAETRAIKNTFGNHARNLAISSTKPLHGHLLSAAGAMEALVCYLSLCNSFIPATANYSTLDPDCDLDYVPNFARKTKLTSVLSNSFGLGGQNCSLIFRLTTERDWL